MTPEKDQDFRPVNQILGTQPSLGPIPADQIIPWTVIFLAANFIINGIFGGLFTGDFEKWLCILLVTGWGIATWWILTGNKSWRFLSQFIGVPRWTRGYPRYQSMLEINYEAKSRQTKRY